jgi:carbon storage regulator
MLILSRRLGERVKIGETVTVIALGLHSSQIRLGIDTPRNVPVHREPVNRRIQSKIAASAANESRPTSPILETRIVRHRAARQMQNDPSSAD